MISPSQLPQLLVREVYIHHDRPAFREGILNQVDGFKRGVSLAQHVVDDFGAAWMPGLADLLLLQAVHKDDYVIEGEALDGDLHFGHEEDYKRAA